MSSEANGVGGRFVRARRRGTKAAWPARRVLLWPLTLPLCAWGQAAPGAAPAVLAPVVVTATRTEAVPFDVPAAIDRVDVAGSREGRAQVNISDFLGGVPGILARDRQNYAQDVQISVRGFGARSSFGIRGVRVIVDGIPATFPDGQGQITNVDLGSAERIEVLRGPSSALYGNSAGGVIQVFTEEGNGPPTLDFGIASGSDGLRRASAKVSGSNGALGYVVGGSHFQTDGYRDHSAAKRDIGNAKLTYSLDDSTKLTLIANSVTLPEAQDPLGLTRALYDKGPPRAVDPSAISFNTRKSIDQNQIGLIAERRLDAQNSVRAMVYAGHRNTEQFQAITVAAQTATQAARDFHPGGVIALGSDYRGTDLRWTLRSALADRPFTLVAGLSADSLDQHRQGYRNFVGPVATPELGVQGDLRRDENDTALDVDEYLQAAWQFAPDWSLSAGLRHSSVRIQSKDHYIVGVNGDDSGTTAYGATLPVLGLMVALNRSVHLYVTAGRGFETPTLNELAYRPDGSSGMNFALQPARSDNLEAGVKAHLEGGGDLTAALFGTRTRNEIVTLTNVAGRSTYQNAGETRRTGLELAWSNTFAENLRAQAAVTALDATYRNEFVTCNLAPCPAASQQKVAAGNRMPGLARGSLFASVAWQPPQGWRGGVEGRYLSSVFVNDTNTDAAPRYFLASANLGYALRLGAWRLNGFTRVDNLFDHRYIGSVIVNEGNQRFFEPAPGRTWLVGASASVSF